MDILKFKQNTKPHPVVFRFRAAEVSLEELSILDPRLRRASSRELRKSPVGHRWRSEEESQRRDPWDGGGGGGGGRKLSTN